MYGFFKHCLKATQDKMNELINIPRARGTRYIDELNDILRQLDIAYKDEQLTDEEYMELKQEFRKIDFLKIAEYRRIKKEKEQMQYGNYKRQLYQNWFNKLQ